MELYREQRCKEKPRSFQLVWWRPISSVTTVMSSCANTNSRNRSYVDLAQIWFNLASSKLHSVASMRNMYTYHHPQIGTDLYSLMCANNKSVASTDIHGLLLRCIPTATCSTHRSNHNDIFVNTSSNVDEMEEDSLPGVRIHRKSYLGQRVNAQISEQDISEWCSKETGIDRVRMMYTVGDDGNFLQEKTRILNTLLYRTVVFGAVMNIIISSLAVDAEKKEKHLSKTHAMLKGLSSERKVVNVLAGSLKTTLKFTVFTALFLHLSQAIAAYRNKSSVWEYVISSSLAFGLLGLGQGVKRCASLSLRGAAFGILGGYVTMKMLESEGLNQEQQHLENVRHHLSKQKLMQQKEELL